MKIRAEVVAVKISDVHLDNTTDLELKLLDGDDRVWEATVPNTVQNRRAYHVGRVTTITLEPRR